MFGINDPGIWSAYLLMIVCLLFSIWFGIRTWNKEDKNDKKEEEQDTNTNTDHTTES